MNSGSRDDKTFETSIVAAVIPPTCTTIGVPRTASGTTRSRSVVTREVVCTACGEVVGITWITAAVWRGLITGVPTAATPGVWRSATTRPSSSPTVVPPGTRPRG